MVDKYEDLGPANALPPPPPPPPGSRQPTAAGSQDRTELRSAQIGDSCMLLVIKMGC